MKSERNDVQMSRWACSLTSLAVNIMKIKGNLSSFQPCIEWTTVGQPSVGKVWEKEGLSEVVLVTSQVTSKSQNKRKGGSNGLHYSQRPDWNMVLHWKMTLKNKKRNCSASIKLQWLWRTPSLFPQHKYFSSFQNAERVLKIELGFYASAESDGAIST